LSEAELKWVKVYKAGDTLIFKSTRNEFDTSLIEKSEVYYPEFMPIEVHNKYLPQSGIVIYKNLKYRDNGEELVRITKRLPNRQTRLFIDYLNSGITVLDLMKGEVEKYKHGKVYEFDTYHLKAKPNEPKKIFWHEDYGIIKYITHDDVIWELVNHSIIQ